MNLNGAHVFITGGSSGIGLETVRVLNGRGARVISGDVQPPLEEIAGVQNCIIDVTNCDSVTQAMREVSGELHVLINNAGIMRRGRWQDTSPDDIQKQFEVNVRGSVNTLIAAIREGKLAPNAVIVQMCSIAGLHPAEQLAAYSLTKQMVHTLIELMRALRPDLPVIGVYPHAIETPMTRAGFASQEEYRQQAFDKWGCVTKPEDLAVVIADAIEDDKAKNVHWNQASRKHGLSYTQD